MKIKAFILLLITIFTFSVKAQHHKGANDRIEAMRAQFLTQKLDLQPEEAQKFWPVYNQYREELDKIQGHRMKELADRKSSDRSIADMSAEEADKLILAELKRQREILNLRETYYTRFKAVIPVQKVALLYKAEIEFKKKLINRLSHRGKKE